MIDFDNNFLITEDPDNSDNQMKFIITNTTSFTSRFGAPIQLALARPDGSHNPCKLPDTKYSASDYGV